MKNEEIEAFEVEDSSNPNEEKSIEQRISEEIAQSEAQQEKERFKNSLVADLENMTLFSDVFFQAAANEKTVQAILAPILQRAGVKAELTKLVVLVDVKVGEIKHGVRYDTLIKDNNGDLIDFEVQQQSETDLIQRSLVYMSRLIDSQLDKGSKYENLKNSCVIFLAKQDIMKKGLPIYRLRYQSPEDSSIYLDNTNLIFVNGTYPYDGTPLADLIHDFNQKDAKKIKIPELKERVAYLKSPKGEKTMDAVFEVAAKEHAKEFEMQLLAKVNKIIAEHEEELVEAVTNKVEKKVEKKVREEVREEALLKSAKILLQKTDLSVEEIAENLGLTVEAVQNLKESLENS